ncbi:hypothetical protein GWK47_008835 [Chionoecetes opilio]|uniref:Nose resistant-to-fluoxetine protein N-terminal domain-containing protein n=1 Tax=Chionoecetes opilio TaxID=41210 RepID=A0A8J4XXE0_CHIOP|nr:hypothetical protein GWK47_008835 [Chionoecetes opilio]
MPPQVYVPSLYSCSRSDPEESDPEESDPEESDPEESRGGLGVLDETLMRPEVRVGIAMTIKEVPPIFSYGTCMPSSCTAEDLKASVDSFLNPVGKKAKFVDCHVEDEPNNLNAGDIVFVHFNKPSFIPSFLAIIIAFSFSVILSVLGVIMFCATTVDLSINYSEKHELRKGDH